MWTKRGLGIVIGAAGVLALPGSRAATRAADDAVNDGAGGETERAGGPGRVCGTRSRKCIIGCHTDDDCPTAARCDQTRSTWVCAGKSPAPAPDDGTADPGPTGDA